MRKMKKGHQRKMKVVNRVRFLMSISFLLVFILSTSMIAFASFDTGSEAPVEQTAYTYTVHSGDTLWSIASDFNTEHFDNQKDIRKIVYAIQVNNHLKDSTIFAGQELVLPTSLK